MQSTDQSLKTWHWSANLQGKLPNYYRRPITNKYFRRYVDRVANSLQQQLRLADKMENNKKMVAEKRLATAAEQARHQPLLKKLIQRTKELQSDIEKAISKKYNNRSVYITGGITTIWKKFLFPIPYDSTLFFGCWEFNTSDSYIV